MTRGQHLGLGNWAAMSRHKHASAKQCSETDQRSEEQECGGRSKCDGISGGWPEVERSLTAQLRHLVMTSRNTEVNKVEQQVASWHSVADVYAILWTKDMTRNESRSVGQCGKRDSEQDGGVCDGLGWLGW